MVLLMEARPERYRRGWRLPGTRATANGGSLGSWLIAFLAASGGSRRAVSPADLQRCRFVPRAAIFFAPPATSPRAGSGRDRAGRAWARRAIVWFPHARPSMRGMKRPIASLAAQQTGERSLGSPDSLSPCPPPPDSRQSSAAGRPSTRQGRKMATYRGTAVTSRASVSVGRCPLSRPRLARAPSYGLAGMPGCLPYAPPRYRRC